MAKKLYEESNIVAIASAIRNKNGLSSMYTVSEMPNAILSIKTDPILSSATFSSNGHYTPDANVDGFSDVIVSVPSMVPVLTSLSVSENGTFAPGAGIDGFDEVIVSIPSNSSGILISKSFSANGTYNAFIDDGVDGYSDVIINVASGQQGDNGASFIEGLISEINESHASLVRDYFYYNNSVIKKIYMENVQAIGQQAFNLCVNLSMVSFPACTTISLGAFEFCYSLTSISFPICSIISAEAFIRCSMLSTVSFPACTSIGQYAFSSCNALTDISFPICSVIYSYAFRGCMSLRAAIFPACSLMSDAAFMECSSLSVASFPVCSAIKASAFRGCKALAEALFPMCQQIDQDAFRYCSSLTEISLPICSKISGYAFMGCIKLSKIYLLSSSIVSIPSPSVFDSTPFKASSYLGYFGSMFVPESLVDTYKSALNWSVYSDRITAYTGS